VLKVHDICGFNNLMTGLRIVSDTQKYTSLFGEILGFCRPDDGGSKHL
jgi:hypothetical protein